MTDVSNSEKYIVDYSLNCCCNNAMVISDQLTMEAILTRDQRTTSHRVITGIRSSELNNATKLSSKSIGVRIENLKGSNKMSSGSLNVDNKMSVENFSESERLSKLRNSSSRRIRYRSGYRTGFTVTWLRLGSLLVTLLVASIQAAPAMDSTEMQMNSPKKWINPCGIQGPIEMNDSDVTELPTSVLLDIIVLQANNALVSAQVLRNQFVKIKFNLTYEQVHELWAHLHYDWLPSTEEIPKNLGEKLDEKYLETLDLNTTLLNTYEYMQKYAVALEQVTWDQVIPKNESETNLRDEFGRTEIKLRQVLCEIQGALVERQVYQRPDVDRSIMPELYRNMPDNDTGKRSLRDWLIFRDYMNGLEYVIQVFDYQRKKIKS